MKKILFTPLLLLSFESMAQTPVLAHEFVVGNEGGSPLSFTEFNNKLYFSAEGPFFDRELWSLDASGNVALAYNINSGASSLQELSAQLIVFNNKLYFNGDNGLKGDELMVYDGMNAPTVAADIALGSVSSSPGSFAAVGGKLYFNADVTGTGKELYVYDGVNAPVLHDLVPGNVGCNPNGFIMMNDKVYFSAQVNSVGAELFVYDPATGVADIVEDIEAGTGSSIPNHKLLLNNKMYFLATTTTHGKELYSYDGTSVVRLTDIAPASANGMDITVGTRLAAYNGQLYFSASETNDYELWKYDPATGTPTLVYNINPSGSSTIKNFKVYAGKLYFTASDGSHGTELWVHDGVNTQLVADLNPGNGSSFIYDMAVFNNKLYMNANDNSNTVGPELYVLTDPQSIKSVNRLADISLSPNPTNTSATLQLSINEDEQLETSITDIAGKVLWRSGIQKYDAGKVDIILPLHSLSAGIYFYHVSDSFGNLLATGKVQKQ